MSEFLLGEISDADAAISRARRDSCVVDNRIYRVYACVGVVVMIREHIDADSCEHAIELVQRNHPELIDARCPAEQHLLFAAQN